MVPEKQERSRYEKYKDSAPQMIELPKIRRGSYLIEYLLEIGPALSTGHGVAPISYQDIQAFQNVSGLTLSPWEAETLRMLSREYVNEYHAARDPARVPPVQKLGTIEQRRAAVVASMKAFAKRGRDDG